MFSEKQAEDVSSTEIISQQMENQTRVSSSQEFLSIMIFLINSTYKIWLPFYVFNKEDYRTTPYVVFFVTELILAVFCVILTLRTTYLVWKIRVFHLNMTINAIAYLSQYYECLIGKFLIIGYQAGVWEMKDVPTNKTYSNWWTDSTSEMPAFVSIDEALPLFVGGFLIWHYLYSMIVFILVFCVERSCATYYLGSYENHSHLEVSTSLLTLSHLGTLYFSYLTFFENVVFIPTIIGCICTVMLSVLIFVIILKVNLKISKRMQMNTAKRSHYHYTLAYRFQVKENLRALQLAQRVLFWISVFIVIICGTITLLFLDFLPLWNSLFILIVDNIVYLNPIIICFVTIVSIEQWLKPFVAQLPSLKFLKMLQISSTTKINPTNTNQETEIYFLQLQNVWK